MARGKRTIFNWRCPDCNQEVSTKDYNKRNNETTMKEKSVFCNQCRAHKTCFRKDASKGSLGNKR